jgi:S-adenosylmethionine:diacylglycerol 3-amino-3-carboxypropyl transferase
MKKSRSVQEQAVVLGRVKAARQLENRRPQAHQDQTKYNRTKAKRLWQKDQEALCLWFHPYAIR